MDTSPDDLSTKILNWLNDEGYPFEMSVALKFQKAGNEVSLADFYTDHETGTQREIDVTALRWSDLNKLAALQVCTRVECKKSNKPWIIFISQAQPSIVPPFQSLCSSGCRVFFIELLKQPEIRKLITTAPLLNPALVGHGLVQAFKEQKDIAHKAIFSSVKASVDRANGFDTPEMLRALTRGRLLSVIAFPAIAVDTQLFECYITDQGTPRLREVNSSMLLWRGISPIPSEALITVVTMAGLQGYVDQFSKTCQILTQLAEEYNDLFENVAREAKESILRRTNQSTTIG